MLKTGTNTPKISAGHWKCRSSPAPWWCSFPFHGFGFFLFNMRVLYETAPDSLLVITCFAFLFLAIFKWTARLSLATVLEIRVAWTMREELEAQFLLKTLSWDQWVLEQPCCTQWGTPSAAVHEVYEEERSSKNQPQTFTNLLFLPNSVPLERCSYKESGLRGFHSYRVAS